MKSCVGWLDNETKNICYIKKLSNQKMEENKEKI